MLFRAPFPLTWISYADQKGEWSNGFWHIVTAWVASHVLYLPRPITPIGWQRTNRAPLHSTESAHDDEPNAVPDAEHKRDLGVLLVH
jgi:hypothetical protein